MNNVSPQFKLTVLLLLLVALMFCSFLLGRYAVGASDAFTAFASWLELIPSPHGTSQVVCDGVGRSHRQSWHSRKKDQRIADDAIEMLGIAHLSQKIFIRTDLRGQTARA